MNKEFWLERWQQNQIGFHSEDINRHLQQHCPALTLKPGSRIFVPLCGKSNDMLWLLGQGYKVIGVELSPLAVQTFFVENELTATTYQQGKFTVSEIDDLRILCGDFFDLTANDLADVDAVFDRASLVALPSEMRTAYAKHMRDLLALGTKILLVAFDYPQHEMSGPPFCVPITEVHALYRPWCDVEFCCAEDILDQEQHFRDRGLSRIQEQVYMLTVI